MKKSSWDMSSEIDWAKFGSGEMLRKLVARDEARKDVEGDFTAEVHGLLDEQGRLYITNVIVTPNGLLGADAGEGK